MNRYILVFIFLILPTFSLAQTDINKDQQELYILLFTKKLSQAKSFIEHKFLKSEDKSRKVVGYVFLIDYYKQLDEPDSNEQLLKTLKKAKEIATDTDKEIDEAYVEYGSAVYYETINKWDLYIKSLGKSIHLFEKYTDQNFMLAMLYISKTNFIQRNYFEKQDSKDLFLANRFAKKSKNNILKGITYNNLAIYYSFKFDGTKEKKYKNFANALYNKSLESALMVADPEAKKILQFNYYMNYCTIQEPAKALEKYNEGLQLYSNESDNFYLSCILLNMGYTYFEMGNSKTALKYYLKAASIPDDKYYMRNQYKIELYQNISEAYEKLHLYDKALAYERKAKETIIEHDQRLYDNNTKSLEAFYQTEQEKNILAERNRTYKKYEIWYISAVASSILGLIFLFFMLYYRQKLNKRTTSLLESEKEKLKMEHELSIIRQEQLQKQALATSIQLEHKNTFINELKESVQKDEDLQHLLKDEQLVDSNFNTIRNIIRETHPNFFKRLNELAKNRLTNLDLKYAAYIYLNMDNIQIANILKVDPKTVSVTKYRLKQKLGVGKSEDLNRFIRNLDIY